MYLVASLYHTPAKSYDILDIIMPRHDWIIIFLPNCATVGAIAVEEPAAPFLLLTLVLAEIFAVAEVAAVSAGAVCIEPPDVAAVVLGGNSGSGGCPAFLKILLIEDTDGIEFGSQTLWAKS